MQRANVKRHASYTLGEITIIRVAHLVISHARIIEYRFLVAMLASLSPSLSLWVAGGRTHRLATYQKFICLPTNSSKYIDSTFRAETLGNWRDLRSELVVAFDVATLSIGIVSLSTGDDVSPCVYALT